MKNKYILEKQSCPKCEEDTDYEIVQKNEVFRSLRDQIEIYYKTTFCRCLVCNEEYQTAYQLDEDLKNIRYLTGKNYCKYNEELRWWECTANPENQINCQYADNKKQCINRRINDINPLFNQCFCKEAIDDEMERNK